MTTTHPTTPAVVHPPRGTNARHDELLDARALDFLGRLHARFEPERRALLARRAARRRALAAGATLGFLPETEAIRRDDWSVAPAPADLADRRVEITGPADRKMIINALNSGATGFMACFEDALTPTFENLVEGQLALREAVAGTISFESPDGRRYELDDETATLIVRPRGWHLEERHVTVGGEPLAGALFDAGLHVLHNASALLERGSGPYLYLPKLESHLEARLWEEVCGFAERELDLPAGAIRATVLIETFPAAFEMDEILYELRGRACGLNAGRWDYIFSAIKCRAEDPAALLPDRAQVTMTVPFMRAYTELLVKTCHRRGAHAMGGMAAFVPNARDPEVTERALRAVRADKDREAADGFDGTWVAHPAMVGLAREAFDAVLGDAPNQLGRGRAEVDVRAEQLLDLAIPGAQATPAGLRANVSVALRYLAAWLGGRGAVALDNLMEDAATAEIARAQVWQWARHGATLDGLGPVTGAAVLRVCDEVLAELEAAAGDAAAVALLRRARRLFDRVALDRPLVEFLTLPAYDDLLAADES